jgi:hypothetical protein
VILRQYISQSLIPRGRGTLFAHRPMGDSPPRRVAAPGCFDLTRQAPCNRNGASSAR